MKKFILGIMVYIWIILLILLLILDPYTFIIQRLSLGETIYYITLLCMLKGIEC